MDKTRKISYQSLKEKLSDEKLKLIIAGSGGFVTGTCAALNPNVNICISGLSKVEAWYVAGCEDLEDGTNCHGGFWCCDCCSSAIWYDEYYCN